MQIEKQNRNLGTACSDTSGTDCSDSMVPITPLRVVPIQRYRHLKGNWKNFMECHVKNDTLLIWFDKENDKIELVRLGSHSELFGKGRKR